jgi:hypothetical protein
MKESIGKIQGNGMRELADRLSTMPENSRKLLARIVELAYQRNSRDQEKDKDRDRDNDRRPNTVYFPELHESCGLDVEAMYETLKPLQSAGLIEIDDQYPFEEIALVAQSPFGDNALAELSRRCELAKLSVWDVVVGNEWGGLE